MGYEGAQEGVEEGEEEEGWLGWGVSHRVCDVLFYKNGSDIC